MVFKLDRLIKVGVMGALALVTTNVCEARTKSDKPNVIFILIDDLGHYGVSSYGSTKVSHIYNKFKNETITTPRIDKLAESGVRCENAYAYPLCEPTRIALMTGQNNDRNYLRPKSQHHSQITFGDVFKKAGYKTGLFGKWKQTRGTRDIKAKEYISEFGWDEYTCFDVTTEGQRFINPFLVKNGKVMNYTGRTDLDPHTGRRWYGPDIFNRDLLTFMETNKDKPFFAWYSMVLVHDEHKPTPDTKPNSIFDGFDENPANKVDSPGHDDKYFPDMVSYMDKLIGKVVDKTDELGIRENTLIVVMGDNGTKEPFVHILPDGSKFPGGKGGNKEQGLHVPLVVNLPGTVKAGRGKVRGYDGLVNITDIYPTICDAAGIDVPNKEHIDGISFWPQMLGADGEPRKYIYTWYNANNRYTSPKKIMRYVFTKDFKRYAPHGEFPEGRFFDLRTDRFEEAGNKRVNNYWVHYWKSGLETDKLTAEQKKAYDKLGKILDDRAIKPVKGLEIIKDEAPLKVGQSRSLSYKVVPANATRRNVIWESSNTDIATIDKFGTITAHKKGKVTVSVYSWDDAKPTANPDSKPFLKEGIKNSKSITIQ